MCASGPAFVSGASTSPCPYNHKAIGWTVQISNPDREKRFSFLLICQVGSKNHPTSYFSEVKRSQSEFMQTLQFSAKGESKWSYTATPPIRIHGVDRRKCTFLLSVAGSYLTDCEVRENQQDATIKCLLSTSVSTCFGHHYAHLQETKTCVTASGVLRLFCWMWLVVVVGRCVVGCEHCQGYCLVRAL